MSSTFTQDIDTSASPATTMLTLLNASDPGCISILAIFYPPLKQIWGCVWLFCRLRREILISQNWLKGQNMATMISIDIMSMIMIMNIISMSLFTSISISIIISITISSSNTHNNNNHNKTTTTTTNHNNHNNNNNYDAAPRPAPSARRRW